MIKDSKGITMLVLIITIVVLLIITGVVIKTVVDTEIVDNSQSLSSGVEITNLKENIKMDILAEKNKTGSSRIQQSNIERILKKYINSDEQLIKETQDDGTEKVVGIITENNQEIKVVDLINEMNANISIVDNIK